MALESLGSSGSSSSYHAGPPWIFRGRALYQLSLVKADLARSFIPQGLKLVEAFGYTLGGLYFGEYDSSPAGKFNEMVVLAGIVWNPPTSCAWAASVMVDSKDARDHGLQEVGLPSRLVSFRRRPQTRPTVERHSPMKGDTREPVPPASTSATSTPSQPTSCRDAVDVFYEEALPNAHQESAASQDTMAAGREAAPAGHLCSLSLPAAWASASGAKGKTSNSNSSSNSTGPNKPPTFRMFLPSFSGRTPIRPELLKYSCRIQCRPIVVEAAAVHLPTAHADDAAAGAEVQAAGLKGRVQALLCSRPVLTISFNDMVMTVQAPVEIKGRLEAKEEGPSLTESKGVRGDAVGGGQGVAVGAS